MEGSGSRLVGPNAPSKADADNPPRSPRSAPQCKITGSPLRFSATRKLTPSARMWRREVAVSCSAENTVVAASSTDMEFSPKNKIFLR
jgi:hypothetical protein